MSRRGKKHKKAKEKQLELKPETTKKEGRMELKSRLNMTQETYNKIFHWIDKAPGEISGLGTIEFRDGIPTVIDAILLLQENGAASTEINADAVALAMFNHHKSKRPGELNFWWHSHVNMGVFWSATDQQTITELGSGGWFVSTVFNKRREQRSCFFVKQPLQMFVDEIPFQVVYPINPELTAQWDAEYEKCCKEKTYVSNFSYPETDYRHWNSRKHYKSSRQEDLLSTPTEDNGITHGERVAQLLESQEIEAADAEAVDGIYSDFKDELREEGYEESDIQNICLLNEISTTYYDFRQSMEKEGYSTKEIDDIMDAKSRADINSTWAQAGGYGEL